MPIRNLLLLFTAGLFFSTLRAHPPENIRLPYDAEFALADKEYRQAEELQYSGRYQKSMEAYKNALTRYKAHNIWDKSVFALSYIGFGYLQMRKFDEAKYSLNTALSLASDNLEDNHPAVASVYNNFGNYYSFKGEYEQAISFYKKTLTIRLKFFGENHPKTADCYTNIGVILGEQDNYAQALNYFQKALRVQLRTLGKEHLRTADSYNNMGIVFSGQGDYIKALTHHQKALKIRVKILGRFHRSVASCYNNMSVAFKEQGDYDRALNFYQKALSIDLKVLRKGHPYIADSYNNIGTVFIAQGDYNRALKYCQKSMEIELKALGKNHPNLANSYNNIGIVFGAQGNYVRALEYYQKSLEIRSKAFGKNHPYIADCYSNMGSIFNRQGNYNRALEYYKKSLEILSKVSGVNRAKPASVYQSMGNVFLNQKNYSQGLYYNQKALKIKLKALGVYHPDVASVYKNRGAIYEAQNEYKQALDCYQKAFTSLIKGFNDLNIYTNPPLKGINSKSEMLAQLFKKTLSAEKLYHQTKSLKDLKLSFNTAQLAADLADTMLNNYSSIETKQALSENTVDIYESGLRTAFELYRLTGEEHYLHQAFGLSERSKSVLLRQELSDLQAKAFAGIPDSLLEKESTLKTQIIFYEKKQLKAEEEKDTIDLSSYQNKLFDKKTALEKLIKKFETDYPDYYRLKYNTQIVSAKEIQKRLPEKTRLIEYFFGKSSVYVFGLSRKKIQMHQITNPSELDSLLFSFRESMLYSAFDAYSESRAQEKRKRFIEWTNLSRKLYTTLLAPVFDSAIEDLIIVPDGKLGHLPFETLLTEMPDSRTSDFTNLPYLFRTRRVSYAYSATLRFEDYSRKKDKAPKQLAGFAPDYNRSIVLQDTVRNDQTALRLREGFTPLLYNEKEVRKAVNIFGGEIYIKKNASKQNFKSRAGDYRILHLAMHSVIDDDKPLYSSLVFSSTSDSSDCYLDAAELYNMKLNANLAVLSACETGYGKVTRGEGVMSLSRAFAYAGVPALVPSLWKVNDRSAFKLTEYFYKQLKKGDPVDEALRQAKISYLDQAEHPDYAHPFFWAAFVPIGDMSPVSTASSRSWLIAAGIIFLIGIAVFVFIQQKKKRKYKPN